LGELAREAFVRLTELDEPKPQHSQASQKKRPAGRAVYPDAELLIGNRQI
jgi:hypothetical protein